jgi:hypothetical protein
MRKGIRAGVLAMVVAGISISAVPITFADTSSANPTASHSVSPKSRAQNTGLTNAQRSAIERANATYQLAIKGALDGANVAIADARSIRDQAIAAAPTDKNVHNLAISDFKLSTTQIWAAFKRATASARAAHDAAIAAIKSS